MIYKKKCYLFVGKSFHALQISIKNNLCSNNVVQPPWRILFFGSDNFSLFSLSSLLKEYRKGEIISKLEVCTSVKKIKNDVHKFSEKENLKIWQWPPDLTQTEFDAGLVVSFGHLIPKRIIEKFPLGMINVHASLLPRWRGAAPIIYSLANGDLTTGVSIMQIEPSKFDVGKIISQKALEIPDDMFMPELNVKLGILGANELIECLKDLPNKIKNAKPQSEHGISYAPKVVPSFTHIDWRKMTSVQVFNLERALRGFSSLTSIWNGEIIKFYNVKKCDECFSSEMNPGFISNDEKLKVLKVVCSDKKFVTIEKVQIFQKKVMSANDFNNGYLKKSKPEQRYFR